jgi:branched-chain amino acid transport system substrate-binding protein
MERRIKGLIGVLVSLLVLSAAAIAEPLKIGAILPLSGRGAGMGVSIKNGMLMAYQSLPAETRALVDLHFEDDAAESRQTVSAVQRFIAEGNVDLLVTAFSNAGNVAMPLTEKAKLPLISLAYDRGISDSKASTFTFFIDVKDLAAAAVAEAARRGYRRVAVVSTLHEGNLAMREQLVKAAQGKIKFPVLDEVQIADTDLNTHALRIKRGPAVDGVAVLMHASHLGLFVKTLRANGVRLPLFTLGNFEDRNVRDVAGASLRGQWYSATEYSAWFLPAYRKQFPKDSTYGAAYGYDLVLLLGQAALTGARRISLPAYLQSAEVSGGAFPKCTADGRNGFHFPVGIKVVGADGIE